MYKIQYQSHGIHRVDKHHRIVIQDVNIDDFAVKLKISESSPAAATFRDETRQHFEHLKGMAGKDIELNKLLNNDDRVVLVCGVPGMGKTGLAKQLAFLWANNKIYTQFKLCIIMECRDINYFVANEGAALKKDELFSEFLTTKFGYDLRGGVSTLLIIDGIDEPEGINKNDSVIWQLLDVKHAKYTKARIILTGRPHVEGKLERKGKDIGGLHWCEIQGLSDDQIQDYVKKFASCKEDFEKIDKAIHSSKEHVKILSIPAFLNSMCCVTLLSDVQTVKNTAELYVWVLYLLLKEHVEKDRPNHDKMCCEMFEEYSSDLWVLCEICHQLLSENKIIFEGDIKSRLLKCGNGAEFIEGLFADISDCLTKKYQFKHVTVMEFLSAVHVSRRKDRMEIIEHNIKTEFYQVVIFSCQLISGYKYDGIIKDMFGNDEELKGIDVEQFLPNVVQLVSECINDRLKVHQKQQHINYLFQLSIEIIMCFINKDVSNKNFIISTFKTLRYKMNWLDKGSMRKVSELCGHLSSAFKCNEEDLKETFENVLVAWVNVDDVKSLTCVKYLPNVEGILLYGMKIKNSFRIRSEANAVAKCKDVIFECCEFTEDGIMENNIAIKDHQLNRLVIRGCKLNKYSFIDVCNWALQSSVHTFELSYIKNIEHSWWGELVDAIQNAKEKNNGILTLRELGISKCTQKMSKEMQLKVRKNLLIS